MNFLYASAHLNIGYLGDGISKAGFPLIPEISNMVSAVLLKRGVCLNFYTDFLVFPFLLVLWHKEIREFLVS